MGDAGNQTRVLDKLVIGVPMPDDVLARLRLRYPDIRFALAPFEAMDAELHDADAVIAWVLTPEQLAGAPRLRWLQSFAAGVDRLALPEFVARNVVITNASGVHAPNIAEHLLALMLAFARALPWLIRTPPDGDWFEQDVRNRVFELEGQTLLLVGLGDIAQALGERARCLGMRVIGVRRRLDQPAPPAVERVLGIDQLGDILPEADHVAICLPLTPMTRGLFDAGMLGKMKPTAYLYNIGRGPIIDSAALIAALEAGFIAGAGLDVTDPEPLPLDSPLWSMPNVVITAHTSGSTPRYWDRITQILERNIDRYRSGAELLNRVDAEAGY